MYGLLGSNNLVCPSNNRTIFGWDTTIWNLESEGAKKIIIIEKIAFKVVQIKSLAMHITNQKLSFDIFT